MTSNQASKALYIQRAENVVKIMIKLFEKRAQGIFNIETGKGIEIKSFVKKLTKINNIIKQL